MNELASFCKPLGIECLCKEDVLFEGERISSSRIRYAVHQADFATASKMMGRSFSYDCTSLEWKEENGFYSACTFSRQVLPKDGKYDVIVKLTATAEDSVELNAVALNTLHTGCLVEKGKIMLFLPTLAFACRVKEIIFKE